MKYILILTLLTMLSACSNYSFTKYSTLNKEEVLEIKGLLLPSFEPGKAASSLGVNYMYQYGYFMYSLYMYGELTVQDGQNYCNAVKLLVDYDLKGFHSLPDWEKDLPGDHGRFMTRDDYQGMLLGLYFVNKINGCAKPYIELANHWFDQPHGLKLKEGEIWGPWHEVCFERANGEVHDYYSTWDLLDYTGGAKVTCSKPVEETSNKLLRMTCIIISRYETPTYWTELSDEFCHDHVNFNQTLDIYYRNNRLGELLKGLL